MLKLKKLILALGFIASLMGCQTSSEDEVSLEKIKITNPADKLVYFAGEELDTAGLEITAFYSDDTAFVVKD